MRQWWAVESHIRKLGLFAPLHSHVLVKGQIYLVLLLNIVIGGVRDCLGGWRLGGPIRAPIVEEILQAAR